VGFGKFGVRGFLNKRNKNILKAEKKKKNNITHTTAARPSRSAEMKKKHF